MDNRLKRLKVLLDSVMDEQGFIAMCQYVSHYEMGYDKILFLQEKYPNSPRVDHLDLLWKRRAAMSNKLLQLEVLEAKFYVYMQNIEQHLMGVTPKEAFKVVKKFQEEFEDLHADIIDKAQIDGICPLHLRKMKYLLDRLHEYYDCVIAHLILKNERNFA